MANQYSVILDAMNTTARNCTQALIALDEKCVDNYIIDMCKNIIVSYDKYKVLFAAAKPDPAWTLVVGYQNAKMAAIEANILKIKNYVALFNL